MANYTTLKSAIQEVIKTNGNNEITGALLQNALLSIINSLGADYQLVGRATTSTEPGSPDQNVAYIAGAGTYPNFGGVTIADGRIGILKYNGGWTLETIPVGKNYDSQIQKLADTAVNIKMDSAYNATGGVVASSGNFCALIPVEAQVRYVATGLPKTLQRLCYFDSDGSFLSYTNVQLTTKFFLTPANTAFIGVTFAKSQYNIAAVRKREGDLIWGPFVSESAKIDIEQYITGIPNYLIDVATTGQTLNAVEGYIIPFPLIPVSEGDVIRWDGSLAYGQFQRYDDTLHYVSHKSATAYSSDTIPAGISYVVLSFPISEIDNAYIRKNGKVVWRPIRSVDIASLKLIVDDLMDSVLRKTDIADNLKINDSTKALSARQGLLLGNDLYEYVTNPQGVEYPYKIQGASGVLGTKSTYKHRLQRVTPGDFWAIRNASSTTAVCYYAFLSSDFENGAGVQPPLVEGTQAVAYHATPDDQDWHYFEIPEGCQYLLYDSYVPRLSIRRLKTPRPVPSWYKDYIKSRAFDVLKKDIRNGYSDSLIFFSDYHISFESFPCSNFNHSPALIEYLTLHTNTRKVFFGGDVFTSPETDSERFELMRAFLDLFNFTKMYTAVGNHEWRQSTDLANDGRKYDLGSLAKLLEDKVTFGRAATGLVMQPYYCFDNPTLKIRYFVLYTPGPVPSSAYAVYNYSEQLAFLESKISEIDNGWKVVIMQHIMYQSSGSVYGSDDFPTKLGDTDCGILLKQRITANNADSLKAKIICVLSGHEHNDYCEFLTDECVSICINCDATYNYYDGSYKIYPNNPRRVSGTLNEQCFDVLHLNTRENTILGTRIGFGYDKIINLVENQVSVGASITLPTSLTGATWLSQNPDIATVNNNGVVTGVAAGRVTIKAQQTGTQNGVWEYFNIIVN